ncbi:MAG TPA: hypothetical protein VMU60_04195 [Syntrophobacteria bacterium]|nr:hypothetical protein [Syntrophobacteria bacterium]
MNPGRGMLFPMSHVAEGGAYRKNSSILPQILTKGNDTAAVANTHYARAAVARSWRWQCHRALTRRSGARGRVIHEKNRIRRHYLLLYVRRASRTLRATSVRGRASLSTINDATLRFSGLARLPWQITPPRAVRSQLEAALTPALVAEPTQLEEKGGQIHGRSSSFGHNVS